MSIPISALLLSYGLVVGLWPLVWLFAVFREGLARRWPVVGRMALLLPLWTVAVSIGGLQIPVLLSVPGSTDALPRIVVAATSVGVALCAAVVGWMLLWRLAKPHGKAR